MPTQVQIRGAAQATQEARTLAARELDINTTDARLCVHDGATAGGMRHVNARDAQNQEFTAAAASGTDTITATYAYVPASYTARQKFGFIAANNNTGAATFNANSVGAVTIKKASDGALADLEADDIVQGAYYEVTHNGTYFILAGGTGGGGGLKPKATATLTGTSVAMTGIFTPGNNYRVIIPNMMVNSGGSGISTFVAQLSNDGGSSWLSSHSMKGLSSSGTNLYAGQASTLMGLDTSIVTGNRNRVEIELFNPGGSVSTPVKISGFVNFGGNAWGSSGGGESYFEASGYVSDASPKDSIRFTTGSSGGLAGNVYVYETPIS